MNTMKPGEYEIRIQEGALDEVVACKPEFFHLEQMDAGHWWMRVDLGGGKAIAINLWTKRGAKILGRAERD